MIWQESQRGSPGGGLFPANIFLSTIFLALDSLASWGLFLTASSYPRFSLCVLDSAASLGLFPANIFLSMIFEKEISLRLILRHLGACFIPTSFPCAQFCGTLGLFPANIFLSTIFLALDFAASWSLFPANIFLATGILALLCISIWALVCISSLALVCIFVQPRLVFIPWL